MRGERISGLQHLDSQKPEVKSNGGPDIADERENIKNCMRRFMAIKELGVMELRNRLDFIADVE